MSDTQEPAAPAPVPPPVTISLDEFCQRASNSTRGVELLAAFRHTELTAGRQRDTAADYQNRWSAIATRPAL